MILTDTEVERARTTNIANPAQQRAFAFDRNGKHEGPCPRCGGTDRFSINLNKQMFYCRTCQPKGGAAVGAISFVMFCDGVDFRTAVESIIGKVEVPVINEVKANVVKVPVLLADGQHEREQHRKAAFLWSQRRPIIGTIAERYLRDVRGYTGTLPETLAFLPPNKPDQHPAMIAAFGLCDEPEPGILMAPRLTIADAAVHLTLLKPDGSGKAEVTPNKMIIGRPLGRPIVLAPPNDLLGLAVCEGIEDALTAHEATGLGAWAAYSAGNMPKLADLVPDYIEAVTIYAHADEAGRRGARQLAKAITARGNSTVLIEGI